MNDSFDDDMLREALSEVATRVESNPDALTAIRSKIADRRRPWRRLGHSRGTILRVGLSAASCATAVIVGISSCSPQPSSSPAPGSGQMGASATRVLVPVYYVGTSRAGTYRLFSEYHAVTVASPTPGAEVAAALRLALARSSAFDPDYGTTWPAGTTIRSVQVDAGVAIVDLGDVPNVPPSPSAAKTVSDETSAAIQQIVWTATARTGITAVRLLFDGRARSRLWGQPTANALHRTAAVDTLASAWIAVPAQGARVHSPMTVTIDGFATQGAFSVTIARGPTIVDHASLPLRPTTQVPRANEQPLSTSAQFTLPPGTYVVSVYIQPFIAKEGPLLWDDHTVTVD